MSVGQVNKLDATFIDFLEIESGKNRKVRGGSGKVWILRFLHPVSTTSNSSNNETLLWVAESVDNGDKLVVKFEVAHNPSEWELLLKEAEDWKALSDCSLQKKQETVYEELESKTRLDGESDKANVLYGSLQVLPFTRLLDYAKVPYARSCLIFIVEYINVAPLRPPVTEEQLLAILKNIIQGVLIMRELGMGVHGDLSLDKLLYCKESGVKIGGFGLKRRKKATTLSSWLENSPERLDKEDVYQIGAVAYELCCGNKPFQGGERDSTTKIQAVFGRVSFPEAACRRYSSQILEVIRRCLSKNPSQRPDSFSLSYIVAAAQGLVPPMSDMPAQERTGRDSVTMEKESSVGRRKTEEGISLSSSTNNLRAIERTSQDDPVGPRNTSTQIVEPGRGLSRDDLYLLHLYHVPHNVTRGPWESYHRPGSFESSLAKATTNTPKPAKPKHIRWIVIDIWERHMGMVLYESFASHLRSSSATVVFKYLTVIYKVMVDGPPEFLELSYRQDQLFEYLERVWSREHLQNVSVTDDVYLFCFAGGEISRFSTLLRLKAKLFHDFSAVFDGSRSKIASYQQHYQQQLLLTVSHGHSRHMGKSELPGTPEDPLQGKREPLLHAFVNLIEHCFKLSAYFLSCNDPCRELKLMVIPSLAIEITKAYFASLSCFYFLTQYYRERRDLEGLRTCYNTFCSGHQQTYTFVDSVLAEPNVAELCREGTLPKLCFSIAPLEAFFEPAPETPSHLESDKRLNSMVEKGRFPFQVELRELLNMGFTRDHAQLALERTQGDVNAAVAQLVDDFASPDKIAKLLDSERPLAVGERTVTKRMEEQVFSPFRGQQHLVEEIKDRRQTHNVSSNAMPNGVINQPKPSNSEQKIVLNDPQGWEKFRQRLTAENSTHSKSDRGYHVGNGDEPTPEKIGNKQDAKRGRPRASSAVEFSSSHNDDILNEKVSKEFDMKKPLNAQANHSRTIADKNAQHTRHLDDRVQAPVAKQKNLNKEQVENKNDKVQIADKMKNEKFEKPHAPFCHCVICEAAKNIQKVSLSSKVTPFSGGGSLMRSLNPSFEIDPTELEWGPLIGQGGFGQVYKARFRGTAVAVKTISAMALVNQNAVKEFQSEVAVLCTLRHPNVILFMGACTRPPHLFIVTEFMSKGTLFDILHRYRVPMNWSLMKRMALDVCRGMTYLHASKLLHRDLKSSNLMLDDHFTVKVGDFGLTRLIATQTQGPMTGQCGTFQYMAPEVLANQPYSEKADVYSFGIILWEMVAKQLPYYGIQPMQVAVAVLSKQMRPPMPPSCPAPLAQLIQSCWQQDPSRRPSFPEIMKLLEQMPY
ncbi:Probable serine/threonine-protein kinase [Galdieria sulphuraria]|nr:Probable serine/threonine-protein kinase [Galdieria sulphuraria]